MNKVKIFNSEEFGAVRTVTINGEPWFVGKDVALALGYSYPQKAVRDHVLEEDRGVNEMDTPSGRQKLVTINESGLYALIFGSKLDNFRSPSGDSQNRRLSDASPAGKRASCVGGAGSSEDD